MPTELRLIKGTVSPSGRYALAYGIPGLARLDHSPTKILDYNRISNYMVDRRSREIMGIVPLHARVCRYGGRVDYYKEGGNHWDDIQGTTRTFSEVYTHWNPLEDRVVIVHDGRWWFEAIYIGERRKEWWQFYEIGDIIEDTMRGYLQRRNPRTYRLIHREDEREPFVGIPRPIIEDYTVLPKNRSVYKRLKRLEALNAYTLLPPIRLMPDRITLPVYTDEVNAAKGLKQTSLYSRGDLTLKLVRTIHGPSAQFERLRVRRTR